MQKNNKLLVQIVTMGILIAMDVILTRFLSIQLPTARIGFGFLPVAICGMMFGPISAMTAGVLGDLIGYFLWPSGGGYFIGFTISAGIRGLIFGYMLKTRGFKHINIIVAALLTSVCLTLLLDTYWLTLLIGKGYMALLPSRAIQAVYTLVVQIVLITSVGTILKKNKLIEA